MDSIITVLVFGLAVCLYMLPSIIAYKRYHNNGACIALVNLFFGWSVLGWLVALIWSLSANVQPEKKEIDNDEENITLSIKELKELLAQTRSK